MAAYTAVINVDRIIGGLIDYLGILISDQDPQLLQVFKSAHKELKSFEGFLERLDKKSRMRMNASLRQIAEETDRFQDAFVSHVNELDDSIERWDQCSRNVQDLKEETQSFIDRLKKMKEYLKEDTHEDEAVDSKSNMVGLSDVYTKLKKEIVGSWVDELVFSLIGMAGIGKTALAKKLFEDLDILEWFDCHAWVTVGRKYQYEEITQTILAQLGCDVHNTQTGNYLRDNLMDKRYLIVLDDVWDTELVQRYLETSSLPNNGNTSRVLLTTRIQQEDPSSYHLINMRLLNKQESWHLLCQRIFAQNSCPFELEKAGKQIADKCDGLPLTILTIADLLSKAGKTIGSLWIEVATQKKHQLFIDAYDEISKVLYPSYENLREDLKLCFLYIGVFPLYYEIPKSKLINMWIVEKIIEIGIFRTLEISGIECLRDLTLHNLVMVFQRSTLFDDLSERIKTCGLHSSWWHFCYKEARKSNLFYILDSYIDASRELIECQSRLTVHNNVLFGIKTVNTSMEENCSSSTHSLLCLGPYHQYAVPICFGLKLLKKLDALNIRFYEFPLEVLELVKLRYLALTCNASLPPSISKLWKLQYLIVHRHLSIKFPVLSYFPIEIWDMKRLKHLHVTGNDLPDVGGSSLPNLLTLSDVSFESCTNGVIGGIPNLKKLGIQIDLRTDAIEPLHCFDQISNLTKLQSLKCVVVNPTCNFEVVASVVPFSMFPLNLKKLCLSGLGYPWEEMSMISSLPNLEVLKLRSNAFQGPKWIVKDDEFPKLSFLLMEDIDLVVLKGRNESFQCLKKVCIKHCYKLRKFRLRSNYKLITNIEVVYCNPLVEREIQKGLEVADELPKQILVNSAWNS